MDWELWTKELDEEVLVENGEFGSQEERLFVFFLLLFDNICTLLSCCHE